MAKRDAVIVAACRTPVGKALKGSLKDARPEEMGSAVLNGLVERAGETLPELIDDVIIGCAFPEASQGLNLARLLVLSLGWPDRVPGMTVNRFCSSGLETIAIGAQRIMCGAADVIVAGGVESMSEIPMAGNMMYPHPALVDARPSAFAGMGLTAENVAERYGVARSEQDAFALESHRRAAAAIGGGAFKKQIVPVNVKRQRQLEDGHFAFDESVFDRDEGVRADTDEQALARLHPVFKKDGTVTAGNSSQMSDGAAAVLLMSRDKASQLGLEPIAVFRQYAVEGCAPEYMGVGPIVAIPKALLRAGLSLRDIGLVELNEAFAAQAIACIDELELDRSLTNVSGGAIALGHPLGSTGAILTNKLLYEMEARQVSFGIVSMCVGFGMGAAGVFEREF